MVESHARTATDKGARYMTQLARHWSHKFEVSFDETQARIVLPIGVCSMTAHADELEVTAEAADDATLTRLEQVVADHLGRFAFREPELALAWVRQAQA